MTIQQALKLDVYSEEFQQAFYPLLEKFVKEFDDMASMDIIAKAEALLKAINDEY